MRNWKKFCITTLGTLGILGTSVLATTGTVNAPSGLVLRQDASKSSAPLATVPDKTEVNIVEENGEWYKVTYNNQEGYLFKEYVNADEIEKKPTEPETPATTEGDKPLQTKSKIKVYVIPVITSTVINEIDSNVELKIEKEITNWSYVSAGDIKGWVRTYGIENTVETSAEEQPTEEPGKQPENPQVEEPEEKQTETPEKPTEPADNTSAEEKPVTATKGFVTVDYANVRKQASTSSEIVTVLTKDTSFEVLAETEEWYKIKYTSPDSVVYEGYMFKNLATTANN